MRHERCELDGGPQCTLHVVAVAPAQRLRGPQREGHRNERASGGCQEYLFHCRGLAETIHLGPGNACQLQMFAPSLPRQAFCQTRKEIC